MSSLSAPGSKAGLRGAEGACGPDSQISRVFQDGPVWTRSTTEVLLLSINKYYEAFVFLAGRLIAETLLEDA